MRECAARGVLDSLGVLYRLMSETSQTLLHCCCTSTAASPGRSGRSGERVVSNSSSSSKLPRKWSRKLTRIARLCCLENFDCSCTVQSSVLSCCRLQLQLLAGSALHSAAKFQTHQKFTVFSQTSLNSHNVYPLSVHAPH